MGKNQLEAKVQQVIELVQEDPKFHADFAKVSSQDELVNLVKNIGIELTSNEAVEAYEMYEEKFGRELSEDELMAVAGGAPVILPPDRRTVIHGAAECAK